MKLIIPEEVKDDRDILEFCCNAEEKLRLLHNEIGQKARDGKIPMMDFRKWQDEYFMPRSDAICREYLGAKQTIIDAGISTQDQLNEEKELLLQSNKYQIDIEKDII